MFTCYISKTLTKLLLLALIVDETHTYVLAIQRYLLLHVSRERVTLLLLPKELHERFVGDVGTLGPVQGDTAARLHVRSYLKTNINSKFLD